MIFKNFMTQNPNKYLCGRMNKSLLAHGALFFVSIVYGANFSVAKYVMATGYLSPFAFIVCRVFAAASLFYLCHKFIVKQQVESSDMKSFFWLSVFGVAANMLMFFAGLSLTTPIRAALVMTITPVSILLIERFYDKLSMSYYKYIGVCLACAGATLVITSGNGDLSNGGSWLGDLLVLLNAISYSIYLVKAKKFIRKYHPITINRYIFGIGSLLVLPFGISGIIKAQWLQLETIHWMAILFVLVFTTFLTYLLNSWAMLHLSANHVGVYIYLQPFLAAIIAIILGTDQLSMRVVLAGLMIFLGVFLVTKENFFTKKLVS